MIQILYSAYFDLIMASKKHSSVCAECNGVKKKQCYAYYYAESTFIILHINIISKLTKPQFEFITLYNLKFSAI